MKFEIFIIGEKETIRATYHMFGNNFIKYLLYNTK